MLCGYLYQVVSKRYPRLLSLNRYLVFSCVAIYMREVEDEVSEK